MSRNLILAALGAASLALPAAASAQIWGAPGYYPVQGYGRYDVPRGDYDSRRMRFPGYPEFRGIEAHIRQEIAEGVRDDLIERDDARDLMGQLRDIQNREAREFRVHGWNLPDDDRYRIRTQLEQLDRLVDQTRDEQ